MSPFAKNFDAPRAMRTNFNTFPDKFSPDANDAS